MLFHEGVPTLELWSSCSGFCLLEELQKRQEEKRRKREEEAAKSEKKAGYIQIIQLGSKVKLPGICSHTSLMTMHSTSATGKGTLD